MEAFLGVIETKSIKRKERGIDMLNKAQLSEQEIFLLHSGYFQYNVAAEVMMQIADERSNVIVNESTALMNQEDKSKYAERIVEAMANGTHDEQNINNTISATARSK